MLASGGVDADGALGDLVDVSHDVEAAALLGTDGTALASTLDGDAAASFAAAVYRVVSAAEAVKPGEAAELSRLEVRLSDGSLFVVRDDDRLAAATTGPSISGALVFHDLGSCLRSIRDDAQMEAADAPA